MDFFLGSSSTNDWTKGKDECYSVQHIITEWITETVQLWLLTISMKSKLSNGISSSNFEFTPFVGWIMFACKFLNVINTWITEVIWSVHLHGWVWIVAIVSHLGGGLTWGFCWLKHGIQWLCVWVTQLWLRPLRTGETTEKRCVEGKGRHISHPALNQNATWSALLTTVETTLSFVWELPLEESSPTFWTSPDTSSYMTFSQPGSHRSQQLKRQTHFINRQS